MKKFFKKSQKHYFGSILGPFCPNLGQKRIFLEKRLCQFFSIRIIYYCAKNQKNQMSHSWENFWRDPPKHFSLISLWDTANFRVLWLIEKFCNLIGQEHFVPYLRNQNFMKYEIWNMKFAQAYKNYSNLNFHYTPNW